MNNEDLARKIVRRLDQGLADISPNTAQRLQAARQAALKKYRPQPAYGLAWIGAMAGRSGYANYLNFRYLLPSAALALTLIGGGIYWQNYAQIAARANEIAEIDAGLLTDDLPIPAYLDNGLDAWLKRSPQ